VEVAPSGMEKPPGVKKTRKKERERSGRSSHRFRKQASNGKNNWCANKNSKKAKRKRWKNESVKGTF